MRLSPGLIEARDGRNEESLNKCAVIPKYIFHTVILYVHEKLFKVYKKMDRYAENVNIKHGYRYLWADKGVSTKVVLKLPQIVSSCKPYNSYAWQQEL